jgi:hypothetical protein
MSSRGPFDETDGQMTPRTEVDRERAIALKGSIRLLADQAERKEKECKELAEFAIDLVDRVLASAPESAES